MKKLLEKDPAYYRLSLGTGNIIYFSHAIDVKDYEYIDLTAKDIVKKIDALIDLTNALELTIQNINAGAEFKKLQEENKSLNEKIIALGDEIAKLVTKTESAAI